jgi:hypothetical protein
VGSPQKSPQGFGTDNPVQRDANSKIDSAKHGSITREEAYLILDGLRRNNARVYCQATCIGWYTGIIGVISGLNENELHFRSDDGNSTFGLSLGMDDTSFFYFEPREMPEELLRTVPRGEEQRSVVGIALPLRVPLIHNYGEGNPPPREKILFHELPPL